MSGRTHFMKRHRRDIKRHRAAPAFAVVAIAAAIAAAPPQAKGQTVDYGQLEKLFAEPVTTSATGSPQRASDVPADMEIVTADDIRRSGATDIPGVLSHVAGVDVLQWTANDADVSVQGYNQPYSSRLLVLIDGRQVYADYYGFTPWSALPVELGAIRQIEVVRGPASALFGFNAVGGVINIITTNPLYDDVNDVALRVGTQGLVEGSLVSTYKFGDLAGLRIEAGGRSDNEFPIPASRTELSSRPANDRGSLDLNGLIQLADDVQFGLDASYTKADQTDMVPSFYELAASSFTTESIKGQLSADTAIGLLQATAYSNWIDGHLRANYLTGVTGGPPLDVVFQNNVAVAQLQDLISIGSDHTLRASLEYRRNENNTTPMDGGNIHYNVAAAGAMWDWKIDPSLALTNAVRVDQLMLARSGLLPPGAPYENSDWNRTFTEFSFNSGVVWQPDDADTLRLTASRGAQLPSLTDFGAIQALTGFPPTLVTGIPDLKPSIVTNFEIGWDRALPGIGAQLRMSLFAQHTREQVAFPANVGFLPTAELVTPGNVGDSRAEGLELELKGTIGPNWRWGLSYTPEIITDHFYEPTAPYFTLDFQHTTPTHIVKFNLGWSSGPWEVDAFARYESRFYGLNPATTAGYVLPSAAIPLVPINDYIALDGRIAYRLNDWATFALSGQNFSQSSQHQTAGLAVQRRVVFSVAAKF